MRATQMTKLKQTLAAALVTLLPFIALTHPANAGSAPQKASVAKNISPAAADRRTFNADDEEHAIIPGFPVARFWGDSEKDFLQATHGAGGAWLALSAGGGDGAFGAGLLTGLSASGQRPGFRVVTGVSTGALMAPFVFIGASRDENLRHAYTTINAGDIFEMAPTRDSLLNSWPLRKMIEKAVTPQLLSEVAAEQRKGRRLFVITVNVDSGRPVVWNMGAIAVQGGGEAVRLFRQVLLASASVPGIFPAVYIDVESPGGKAFREMHADGGIYAQFYVAPESILLRAGALPATDLYVIVNGKLRSDFVVTDSGALSILARSMSVAATTAIRGQLLHTYFAARHQNIGFHAAMVAPTFIEEGHGPFNPTAMQALFQFGKKQGEGPLPFLSEPPGLPNATTVGLDQNLDQIVK